MSGAPRPYLLECEHSVWFRPEYGPSPGDIVFCIGCGGESRVITHDTERGTYYADGEWKCYSNAGKTSWGICYVEGIGCGYEYTAPFNQLRTRMERHNRRGCDHEELEVKYIMLPPNSPPPF